MQKEKLALHARGNTGGGGSCNWNGVLTPPLKLTPEKDCQITWLPLEIGITGELEAAGLAWEACGIYAPTGPDTPQAGDE